MAWFEGNPARHQLRFFLWPRRRTQYSGPCQVLVAPFLSRYFQDGGIRTSFIRRSFIHCFLERGVFWLCLFTATELSSFVASFETTPETWKHLPSWDGSEFVFEWFSFVYVFTGHGIIRISSRCWRKIAKIFVKMDTESWKLPLK